MHLRRLVEHEFFNATEIATAATLDHVGRERPRAAGEADERDFAVEFFPNQPHRVHDVPEVVFRVRHAEPGDVGFAAHRLAEAWAFAVLEIKLKPHGVGDGEDVGEQNRGIERKTAQRLQRHLAGELGRRAQRHKVAGLLAHRAVLGQVAPRLAHDPHRRDVHRLAQQRTQQTVVFQFDHMSF